MTYCPPFQFVLSDLVHPTSEDICLESSEMALLSLWVLVLLSGYLTTDLAVAPNPIHGNNQQSRGPFGVSPVLRNPRLRLGLPTVKPVSSQNINLAPPLSNHQGVHVIGKAGQQNLLQQRPGELNQSHQLSQSVTPSK